MKESAFALCLALICSLLLEGQQALASPKAASTSGKSANPDFCQGYKISQYHMVTGDHQITYCARGLRDDYRKNNVTTVALPPTWQSYTFNRHTLLCYKATPTTFKGYLHPQVTFTTGRSVQSIVSTACGKSKKFDLNTTVYQTPAKESKQYLEAYLKTRARHGAIKAARYEVTKEIGIPEPVSLLLAETFGILNKSGFAVEVVYTDASDDLHNYLTTSKLAKSKINMQDFALPKGLKFVSDINRVFNSADSLDAEKYLMDY
ncbi:MAG: hypothetical protein QG625_523 [Cyanobacteriota bacterium erpe_2018_sw_39hr_WHONDRS-SW48-000098_B_bin.30]|nr:hypothetical protein [Cyanobacteriota bacterium erpe_2018_sw_39hr_WHONDRS-SW48-000098_B_bin.30]